MSHYVRFSFEIIPDLKNSKNLSEKLQKEEEGKLIFSKITSTDRLILLDENGKEMNSVGFSTFLQKQMNSGIKQLGVSYWRALWVFGSRLSKSMLEP